MSNPKTSEATAPQSPVGKTCVVCGEPAVPHGWYAVRDVVRGDMLLGEDPDSVKGGSERGRWWFCDAHFPPIVVLGDDGRNHVLVDGVEYGEPL